MNMNKKVNNSPCLDCENRKVNCHSSCREYQIYRIKNDYYMSKERKKKNVDQDYMGFRQDAVYKMSKAQNKRWAR